MCDFYKLQTEYYMYVHNNNSGRLWKYKRKCYKIQYIFTVYSGIENFIIQVEGFIDIIILHSVYLQLLWKLRRRFSRIFKYIFTMSSNWPCSRADRTHLHRSHEVHNFGKGLHKHLLLRFLDSGYLKYIYMWFEKNFL